MELYTVKWRIQGYKMEKRLVWYYVLGVFYAQAKEHIVHK